MAPSHTTNDYTNPEVRYERSDANVKEVVTFGTFLLVLALGATFSMSWFGDELLRWEKPRKAVGLPPAAVDQDRQPPEPRLEAFDDINRRDVGLFPPRAETYVKPQLKMLEAGNPARNVEAISKAIDQLADRLPTRAGAAAAPATNTVRLPSKAASGRVTTGGQ